VQAIIASRKAVWHKSKLKNDGRPRFVVNSIATCTCNEPLYGRYGSRGSHLDAYYCKTRHKGGPGCGMQAIKRIDLDGAIDEMVTQLCDVAYIIEATKAAMTLVEATPNPHKAKLAEARAGYEQGRKTLLESMRKGRITGDEFDAEIKALEREVRALEAMLPPPVPQVEPMELAAALEVFRDFAFFSFDQKVRALRSAIREVIVDSHARAITTVVVRGGFLGKGVNSVRRSRWRCSRQCPRPGRLRRKNRRVGGDLFVAAK
jgi:hypothetical protein